MAQIDPPAYAAGKEAMETLANHLGITDSDMHDKAFRKDALTPIQSENVHNRNAAEAEEDLSLYFNANEKARNSVLVTPESVKLYKTKASNTAVKDIKVPVMGTDQKEHKVLLSTLRAAIQSELNYAAITGAMQHYGIEIPVTIAQPSTDGETKLDHDAEAPAYAAGKKAMIKLANNLGITDERNHTHYVHFTVNALNAIASENVGNRSKEAAEVDLTRNLILTRAERTPVIVTKDAVNRYYEEAGKTTFDPSIRISIRDTDNRPHSVKLNKLETAIKAELNYAAIIGAMNEYGIAIPEENKTLKR